MGQDIDGVSPNDYTGFKHGSISLNDTVDKIAVTSHTHNNSRGQVRIFEWDGALWNQIGQDIDGEFAYDESGISVDLSSNGLIVAIGAHSNNNSNGTSK